MMKQVKLPILEMALRQIPKKYLKENLLPLLEDEKSPLLFSGNIVFNKDGITHM